MRIYVSLLASLFCAGCVIVKSTPPNVETLSYASYDFFMLQKDMVWEIGNTGVEITVPAGFVTDLASVPEELWSFGLSPADKYTRAAIIHDYLYWTQSCTKPQSDNLLKIAMIESDTGWFKKTAVYKGVVWGGQSSWDNNTNDAAAGWIKIAPPVWRDIPAGVEWSQHRAAMRAKNVTEDKVAKGLPYCKYGNSTDVPIDPNRPPITAKRFNEKGDLEVYVVSTGAPYIVDKR